MNQNPYFTRRVSMCECMCCHTFILDVRLAYAPAGVTQEELREESTVNRIDCCGIVYEKPKSH